MIAESVIVGILTSSLPAGLIFYLSGKMMQRRPPAWPNYWYGYRTPAALRTKETFNAANSYAANLLIRYGGLLIVLGCICAVIFSYTDLWVLLFTGMTAVLISVAALIIKTERYLRQQFGKDH